MNLLEKGARHARDLVKRVKHSVTPGTAGGGHTESALYCYGVWMRHLVGCCDHAQLEVPSAVAEIGPGRSLGTCLAAILSGANHAWAFDHIRYVDLQENVTVLDELIRLFQCRAPIPDERVLPRVFPALSSYEFPRHILTDDRLAAALVPARLAAIRRALEGERGGDVLIDYIAPWDPSVKVPDCLVDLVFSQAVMLYVRDLEEAYAAMRGWLRPGGAMSHTINFTSIGIVPSWDGHWNYDDDNWLAIEGIQPYRISRHPYSMHVQAMKAAGLGIAHVASETAAPSTSRDRLAKRFDNLSDEDRTTARAFIIARCL